MISGIQHYIFCKRQWSLIHVEKLWEENYYTIDGQIKHERADDSSIRINRKDLHEIRALPVSSARLGLVGQCDVVEFRPAKEGAYIPRYQGTYSVFPVEYKRGKPKKDASDEFQLCAQAMCLEDMLMTRIDSGALFYFETRRREEIIFTDEMRLRLENVVCDMHRYYDDEITPRVRFTPKCRNCSLNNLCLPEMEKCDSVEEYIRRSIEE